MPPMIGRPHRASLSLLASLLVLAAVRIAPDDGGGAAAQALPPLPARWPATLQLGQMDGPGGAAAMRSVAGFGFRYQYLAGGVNTGGGWATWDADGRFVTYYIQESVQAGIVPVFSYYQIFQSAPGGTGGEAAVVYANLQNTATMRAYYADLKLFFQRAGAFPSTPVVFHVEPDLWGYMQQRSAGDDAATVPVQVAATGFAEVAGLPNTLAGFARAVADLRDAYAPNVVLGYHLSIWGTGVDPIYANPSDAEIDTLATRAGNFYRSLGGRFDVAFAEFSDRDAGFKQYVYGDGGASWWDAADFRRNVRFLGRFTAVAQKRIVMWQIPYGNTKMRAMNNSWQHYQDNRVEWLLDDPGRGYLNEYLAAGVVAFLFGRGADGATCACDAAGDGITNPAPINGNTRASLNADDDGGFFREKAQQYYAAGALALPGGGAPAPTPTATPPRTVTPTATATRTATPTATPTTTPPPPATQTATATAVPPRTPTATATPPRTPMPAPTDALTACPIGQFRAQYFADRSLGGTPRLTRCEARIDYDWAGGGPVAGVGPDDFSVRWNGRFTFAGGPATFIVTADDGIRLWVDGVLVIDAWRDQAPAEYRATRTLGAGVHRLRVEYYEHGGGAVARVRWE